MNIQHTASAIESILFASGDPVLISRLAEVLGVTEEDVGRAIDFLVTSYQEEGRGLSLAGKDGAVRLTTRPDNASFVEKALSLDREGPLSRAALETLSIVAYRGPISHTEIEVIRGVNSSISLRALLLRGLIERRENPSDARGYVYSVSFSFLESMGISDISELPDYDALSKGESAPPVSSSSLGEDSRKESPDSDHEERFL